LQQNLPEAKIAERHKHMSLEKRMHSFLTPIARQTSNNLGSRGFEIAQMLFHHRDSNPDVHAVGFPVGTSRWPSLLWRRLYSGCRPPKCPQLAHFSDMAFVLDDVRS
jgi:hypothetical protein